MEPVTMGIGIVMALGSMFSSASAAREQAAAIREMNAINAQRLAFAKDLFADWQKRYGPINSQLAEYYANTSATSLQNYYEKIGSGTTDQVRKKISEARTRVQEQLQQQGIKDSGTAISAQLQLEAKGLETEAQVNHNTLLKQMNAQREVMADKFNFAKLGLQEQSNVLSVLNSGFNSQIEAQKTRAQVASAQQANAQRMLFYGLNTLGSGLGGMQAEKDAAAAGFGGATPMKLDNDYWDMA